jgi:hypothetical protein
MFEVIGFLKRLGAVLRAAFEQIGVSLAGFQ